MGLNTHGALPTPQHLQHIISDSQRKRWRFELFAVHSSFVGEQSNHSDTRVANRMRLPSRLARSQISLTPGFAYFL
jgi:hypothetical protein